MYINKQLMVSVLYYRRVQGRVVGRWYQLGMNEYIHYVNNHEWLPVLNNGAIQLREEGGMKFYWQGSFP